MIEVGKYYTLDIEVFDYLINKSGTSKYFGIVIEDIEIFKNNKPHKCVFYDRTEEKEGINALYFEGQKRSNSSRRFKRDFWNYKTFILDCFKEWKPIIQEEMEV